MNIRGVNRSPVPSDSVQPEVPDKIHTPVVKYGVLPPPITKPPGLGLGQDHIMPLYGVKPIEDIPDSPPQLIECKTGLPPWSPRGFRPWMKNKFRSMARRFRNWCATPIPGKEAPPPPSNPNPPPIYIMPPHHMEQSAPKTNPGIPELSE